MDCSLAELANRIYEQTKRQSKWRQWIMLAVGLVGVLILGFTLSFWVHRLAPGLKNAGHGFMHGYANAPGAAWLARSGPYLPVVTILWGAGFVIALAGEACIWLAERFHLFGLISPAKEPLPIMGVGERALSQIILRECQSIEGIYLLRLMIGKNGLVRYGIMTFTCSLLFGIAAFLVAVLHYGLWR